jgi:hypothetical protein
MPEVNGKESIEERVGIVLDELSLGIRWERPSLILAIYRSEIIKKGVQSNLVNSLGKSGQAVFQYSVNKSYYDIPVDLVNHPNHQAAIYFVNGLRWGGGRGYSNAYRALNMHREYFIEGNIRAIFWLTKNEAIQCSHFAPDFWAFRHKVVEFLEVPSQNNNLMLKSSIGTIQNPLHRKGNDFRMEIAAAEEYYAVGCIDDAILNYRRILRKHPDLTAINMRIAEIHLSVGQVSAAKRILAKLSTGEANRRNYLAELSHLQHAVNSFRPCVGGISKQNS